MHRLDRAKIIEMLGIDVGDNADLGWKPREGAIAFIGFNDHPLALAKAGVRAPSIDDAAGDDGWLFAGFREDVRQQ